MMGHPALLMLALLVMATMSLNIIICSAFISPGLSHVTKIQHSQKASLFPPLQKEAPRHNDNHHPSLLKMVALRKQGGFEIGIQIAQLLMEPGNHNKLKQSIKKKYPLIPNSVLNSSVDIAADAFKTLAPDKLKKALSPGGMEEVRPDLQHAVVELALKQQVVQDMPVLSEEGKTKLVNAVVDAVVENVLKDAEYILATPEVRLEALEEEISEVKTMMGPWRLALYRVRKNPIPFTVAAVVLISVALRYVWKGDFLFGYLVNAGKDNCSKVTTALPALRRLCLVKLRLLGDKLAWIFSLLVEKLLVATNVTSRYISNKAEFIHSLRTR